ncbi:MAG: hypothetical protein MHPSP_002057, partial [Paramarteilia canceri]
FVLLHPTVMSEKLEDKKNESNQTEKDNIEKENDEKGSQPEDSNKKENSDETPDKIKSSSQASNNIEDETYNLANLHEGADCGFQRTESFLQRHGTLTWPAEVE